MTPSGCGFWPTTSFRLPRQPGLKSISSTAQSCRERLDQLIDGDRLLGAVRHYAASHPTEAHDVVPAAGDSLKSSPRPIGPSPWAGWVPMRSSGSSGRGGMGVVFKAYDPALSRNVAIKVLSASLASCGAARRRFLREARAAAAVVHEHVVSVFAVVETSGLPFLVMEYVPGRSLADRLDRDGSLGLAEILRIGMQTAAGLSAAHAQGLVHRDVKPANILLENGVERVRLTDFGLARAAADAGVTQSGVIAGTPHYMAPEQARGDTTDQRPTCSAWEARSTRCALVTPHSGPSRRWLSCGASATTCLAPFAKSIPRFQLGLQSIIARLHAKDPSRRYQSASEVADLLGRCLAHVQEPGHNPLPALTDDGAGSSPTRRSLRRQWRARLASRSSRRPPLPVRV